MAIITGTMLHTTANFQQSRRLSWVIYQWLKARGWTVKGAANGTSGGMDGAKVEPTEGQWLNLNTTTWVVMESPHVTGKQQILLGCTASATGFLFGFCPAADLTTAGTAQPTSSSSAMFSQTFGPTGMGAAEQRWNMVYDDVTFEWAVISNIPGDRLKSRSAAVFCKLDVVPSEPATPINTHVLYVQATSIAAHELSWAFPTDYSSITNSRSDGAIGGGFFCRQPNGTPQFAVAVPLQSHNGTSTRSLGAESALTPTTKRMPTYPITLFSRNTPPHYIGVLSDFFMWSGRRSFAIGTVGTTLGDKDRLCCNDFNFKWDGVTEPTFGWDD